MHTTLRSALAALLFAGSLGSASAAIQLYSFTATVNGTVDLPGALVTGSFSFDDAAPPSSGPYSSGATWYSALQSFSFVVGPLSGSLVSSGGTDSILIRDNFSQPTPTQDGFFIQPQAMTGTARAGNALVSAYINLVDSSQTVFSSSGLPTTPLSVGSFDSRLLQVQYANGSDFYATINSITPVPEASEWAMMLAGLGLVGAIVRRRRQTAA